MAFDSKCSNMESAMDKAIDFLEDLANIDMIDSWKGSEIGNIISDLQSAKEDCDEIYYHDDSVEIDVVDVRSDVSRCKDALEQALRHLEDVESAVE